MHHSQIWQDILTAVDHAIDDRLYTLDEGDLIDRADALLTMVPIASGTQPTTALLLRRYNTQLHQELCVSNRPRAHFETMADELRELTRAVVVAIDSNEGISVDISVLIALVLHVRGIATFCATPSPTPSFT